MSEAETKHIWRLHMNRATHLSVVILLILMMGAGCESVSWHAFEGENPEWFLSPYPHHYMVPVYGIGIGASWPR